MGGAALKCHHVSDLLALTLLCNAPNSLAYTHIAVADGNTPWFTGYFDNFSDMHFTQEINFNHYQPLMPDCCN